MNNAQRFLNLSSVLGSTKEAEQVFGQNIANVFHLGNAKAWLFDDESIAFVGPNRRDTFESALALQEAINLGPRALASNLWC